MRRRAAAGPATPRAAARRSVSTSQPVRERSLHLRVEPRAAAASSGSPTRTQRRLRPVADGSAHWKTPVRGAGDRRRPPCRRARRPGCRPASCRRSRRSPATVRSGAVRRRQRVGAATSAGPGPPRPGGELGAGRAARPGRPRRRSGRGSGGVPAPQPASRSAASQHAEQAAPARAPSAHRAHIAIVGRTRSASVRAMPVRRVAPSPRPAWWDRGSEPSGGRRYPGAV